MLPFGAWRWAGPTWCVLVMVVGAGCCTCVAAVLVWCWSREEPTLETTLVRGTLSTWEELELAVEIGVVVVEPLVEVGGTPVACAITNPLGAPMEMGGRVEAVAATVELGGEAGPRPCVVVVVAVAVVGLPDVSSGCLLAGFKFSVVGVGGGVVVVVVVVVVLVVVVVVVVLLLVGIVLKVVAASVREGAFRAGFSMVALAADESSSVAVLLNEEVDKLAGGLARFRRPFVAVAAVAVLGAIVVVESGVVCMSLMKAVRFSCM